MLPHYDCLIYRVFLLQDYNGLTAFSIEFFSDIFKPHLQLELCISFMAHKMWFSHSCCRSTPPATPVTTHPLWVIVQLGASRVDHSACALPHHFLFSPSLTIPAPSLHLHPRAQLLLSFLAMRVCVCEATSLFTYVFIFFSGALC